MVCAGDNGGNLTAPFLPVFLFAYRWTHCGALKHIVFDDSSMSTRTSLVAWKELSVFSRLLMRGFVSTIMAASLLTVNAQNWRHSDGDGQATDALLFGLELVR